MSNQHQIQDRIKLSNEKWLKRGKKPRYPSKPQHSWKCIYKNPKKED